ncbi:ovarian cancer G-protein coupled receptor 1-like [Eublepharis macularius]|uniref:Ovarian cancer G-protein coupled receptor 1-like n=1 Tax=Eublepharis macularius TaxID=481883 RepID=A0AA97K7G1_EUBMA|nr:ovarian cancer G-protein coupled receptor 1-like [Eublepharis macularius]
MAGNNSSCYMAYTATKYFKIPVYCLVVAAGLPLNCLALWALISQMKRSVILSVYVLNLILANLLQISMLPFWIYFSYNDHYWALGAAACLVVRLAFRTNFYAKNNFLCLIAMERYFGLIHPFTFHRLQTMHGAIRLSVATWLAVAVLCVVGILLETDVSGNWHKSCLDGSCVQKDYAHFKLATMSLSFFLPCVLMGFFYFRVLFELRKVESLEKRVKKQIYGFISLIIASFFLTCVPYQVTSYYKYFWELRLKDEEMCAFESYIFDYTNTTLCLTTLGNISDPLLYILLLKEVREDLRGLFRIKDHKAGISYMLEGRNLPPHTATEGACDHLGTQ